MASLSRMAQLQQFSRQVLEDLVFCGERWPQLAELPAQVLGEQQSQVPPVPVDQAGANNRAGKGSARAGPGASRSARA
jgi:hypothetical protein